MFPNGTRMQDDDLDLYVRLPKVSNDNSCSNKVKQLVVRCIQIIQINEKIERENLVV